MGGSHDWRVPQGFGDYLRATEKRLLAQERRASPVPASVLLGPGMAARAVQILNWDSEEATYNGFFWSAAGALNSPDTNIAWNGNVIARDDGSGMQQVWNVDESTGTAYWVRTYVPSGNDDGLVTFTAWKRFATESGFIGRPEIDPPLLATIDDTNTFASVTNRVFRQPTAPVSTTDWTLRNGDTWFDSDDGNHIYFYDTTANAGAGGWVDAKDTQIAESAAAAAQAEQDATTALNTASAAQTTANQASSDASAAQTAASNAQTAANNAQSFAQTRAKVYYQGTAPTGGTYYDGDIWFNTSDGNHPYYWKASTSTWTDAQDADIAAAQTAANNAQTTANNAQTSANGKNKVTYATTTPGTTANTAGDIWFQQDGSGVVIGQWVGAGGTAWNATTVGNQVIAALDAGKITTGFLSGNRIDANTITGTMIQGTAIDGKTITGAVLQTTTTASRGVKFTSNGLYGWNSSGTQTFNLDATTGNVTITGALASGSTVTGAVITGGTIQTTSTANAGIKLSTTGLNAYNGSGAATLTVDASTGSVTMLGTLQSGSTITGATITGGTIQTTSTANSGIKIGSSGLTAYNGSGAATLTVDSASGAVTMLGTLQSGSTITGATITGGTIQTTSTANSGIKITSGGLYAYDGTNATFTANASTGAVTIKGALTSGSTIDGAIVTGGTIQTESTTSRGLKLSSTGMTGYDGSGNPTFVYTSSTGAVSMTGTLNSGSTITGATVTGGTLQTSASASTGIKITSAGITGYNSTGGTAFNVDGTTGAAVITGTISTGQSPARRAVLADSSHSNPEIPNSLTNEAGLYMYPNGTDVTPARVASFSSDGRLYLQAGQPTSSYGYTPYLQLTANSTSTTATGTALLMNTATFNMNSQLVINPASQDYNDVTTAVGNKPPLMIGDPNAAHIRIDNNEFQTMATASTTAPLYLNLGGGTVQVGPSSGPTVLFNTQGTIKIGGSGTTFSHFRCGNFGGNSGSGGTVVINHGGPSAPSFALAVPRSASAATTCVTGTFTSTQFTVTNYNGATATSSGTNGSFDWIAIWL